ncbi:hypothetical protein SAMN05421738_111116 [Algoriella xinjiangensis]|uniref:Uncharacterized protein n=1 Tax=Algoriella xinjiangensis TaxID=684065 RepID=A0A1I4YMH9_9FLAO|nr:hypothetical protein [Algoriella xinjiangensis]SFN39258.1 hypothetical protein SAMN05421738_111116 [Algoriella xinjiangensis]
MKEILFLGVTQFVDQHIKYVDVNNLYKPIPKILKPIRKIFFDFNLPFKSIWVNKNLYNDIQNHKTIILSATQYNQRVSKIIDTYHFKDKRFIFWYWNPVDKIALPKTISKNWEVWAFDKKDCERYNLCYNNTYYFNEFVQPALKSVLKQDILFVGQDKDRLGTLINLSKEFKQYQLSYYFHIVKDQTSKVKYDYKEKISYQTILDLIQSSRVLLDIVQEGQTGLTQRIMEGLFFGKKIITNNKEIVRYNFYDPKNIFILDVDSIENLQQFMAESYHPVSCDIINEYTISSWLLNFNVNNE